MIGTDGTEKNFKEATEFSNAIKETIGEKKVKVFLNLDINKIADIYYAMDFFILTSNKESFGRTAIEAMSRKNIVMGTNVDGLAEVIGEKNHLISSERDVYRVILKYKTNPEKMNEVKEFFYNRYHEKFSFSKYIGPYRHLYNTLLKNKTV